MSNPGCHVKEGLEESIRTHYWRDVCEDLDIDREHEGHRYCVLHYPDEDKKVAFEKAVEDKLEQKRYNFDGVIFPRGASTYRFENLTFDTDASFREATFVGKVSFMGANFEGAADFSAAKFNGDRAVFTKVDFGGHTNFSFAKFRSTASFVGAKFIREQASFFQTEFRRWAGFSNATFGHGAEFTEAKFKGEAEFSETTFNDFVSFAKAEFDENVLFRGDAKIAVFDGASWVHLDYCLMKKPELCKFERLLLHPAWFVNMDCRKLSFTTVEWYGIFVDKDVDNIQKELKALKLRRYDNPYSPLAIACRRLSANMEENREYFLANEFHYWSLDAWRIGSWSVVYETLLKEEARRDIEEREQRVIGFRDLWSPSDLNIGTLFEKDTWSRIRDRRRVGVVNSLYWALSGYGVRAGRALGALATIAVVFAMLYMLVGHPSLRVLPIAGIWQALADAGQAVMYSLGVSARLRPEPIPQEMGFFQILVTVEGILGPLQIALLALAVRRKVMR